MRLYLTALTTRYGSQEAYVEKALGLDPETLSTTLRANLLEPAPTAG
jgi:protein-tyrosine phosphatase